MKADFDIAADQYDTIFTYSNIGKAQRNRVFKYVNQILNKGKKLSILELNCGTGADAIHFGNLGHHVIATDISEGMIAVAKAKDHPKNVTFKVQDINTISSTTFDTKFDLIFSNFGGLNCLSKEQLNSFLNASEGLLKPNGKLILVVMPKHCLWERLYFTLKGDATKAKRRNTNISVAANVDGVSVETWYFNPDEIIELSKSKYKQELIKPVGMAIPPSYLERSFIAKKPILPILKGLDSILTAASLAKYADHFLIVLEKKN